MSESSTKYQHLAAICVNLMSMGYGTVAGWLSPSLLILQSNDSPLETGQVTLEEGSWIGSMLCIGGVIGNYLFGWIADRFGRKLAMLLVSVPLLISWILIIVGKNVTYLLIARFLGGVAGGSAYVVVPLYITEISEDRLRGSLGAYMINFVFLGILLSYILGEAVSYGLLPYLLMIVPIVFFILFIFFPETPQQLIRRKKLEEAEQALRYFRNLRRPSQKLTVHFISEFEKYKEEFLPKELEDCKKLKGEEKESLTWDDFKTKPAIKSFSIAMFLIFINQFTGCFALLNYTALIFLKSGSTLSPNISAIIVGVVQLLGSICATISIDRFGRKILLLVSTFGTFVGHLILGLYTMFDDMGYDVTAVTWIPIVSFSEILFVGAMGVLTVPFVIIAELTPPKIRGINVTVSTSVSWLFAFAIVKVLPLMVESVGLHGTMFFFSACSIVGALITLGFVPETKGKSVEEIQKIMS